MGFARQEYWSQLTFPPPLKYLQQSYWCNLFSTVVKDTGQHKRYSFSERKVSEPKALDSLILLCMFAHKIYKEYHPQVDVYFLTH